MSSDVEGCLSVLIVALFGVLFLLQIKFPNASRRAETAVLLGAAIFFFSICSILLDPHKTLSLTNRKATPSQVSAR